MSLLEKIRTKRAVIGIIGLGYVGIPLALRFSGVGFKVLGFDIDRKPGEGLERGSQPHRAHSAEEIAAMVSSGFEAVTDFSRIGEATR